MKEFFKHHFGKDLKELELCVKGWNWGETVFKGSRKNTTELESSFWLCSIGDEIT